MTLFALSISRQLDSLCADWRLLAYVRAGTLSTNFWMRVGKFKGLIRRVSLADCFAIELAASA